MPAKKPAPTIVWLDNDEAAAYINRTSRTLEQWRYQGKGPRYHKPPGKSSAVQYRQSDLDEWLAANTVTPVNA